MKKIIHIVIWTVLIIGVVVLLAFTKSTHNERSINELIVKISYAENAKSDILITYEDVESYLFHHFDSIEHKSIGEVSIFEIEQKLSEMDYVEDVEAFIQLNGDIHISITQRRPLIRIMHQNGESYYLDREGKIMPIRDRYPSKLMICNGFIGHQRYVNNIDSIPYPENADYEVLSQNLKDIYFLAKEIDDNPLLKTQVTQIYLNEKKEFELIPLIGDQIIYLGDISRLKEKLMYLETFYHQETNNLGWTQYKTLNLKFRNQVVCTKK